MPDLIEREDAKRAYCKSFCYPGAFCPDERCYEVHQAFDAIPGVFVAYEEKETKMKVKLDPGAVLPERAHKFDAGLDLFCRETICIPPWQSYTFDTGVHIELPPGFFGKIESKSGLNVKHGIVSCGGVIDEGYTGSIAVKLYNLTGTPYTFSAGDKIAQLIIQPCATPEIEIVQELEETERGNNGFGSTGK